MVPPADQLRPKRKSNGNNKSEDTQPKKKRAGNGPGGKALAIMNALNGDGGGDGEPGDGEDEESTDNEGPVEDEAW